MPAARINLHTKKYKWRANDHDLRALPRSEVVQTLAWCTRGLEINPWHWQSQNQFTHFSHRNFKDNTTLDVFISCPLYIVIYHLYEHCDMKIT